MGRVAIFLTTLTLSCLMLEGCVDTGGARSTNNTQQQSDSSCRFFSKKMILWAAAGGVAAGATQAAIEGKADKKTAIAATLGLLAGAAAGHYLAQKDCAAAQAAMQKLETAPVGQSAAWVGPQTGDRGSVTPTGASAPAPNGKLCRPYREAVRLSNGSQNVQEGIACRDSNGNWSVES